MTDNGSCDLVGCTTVYNVPFARQQVRRSPAGALVRAAKRKYAVSFLHTPTKRGSKNNWKSFVLSNERGVVLPACLFVS